ncbi:WecB/TagA/CpsF family glycosyltransferase [Spirulina sp. CS-785/01]|uniref:WecB/TagA/CpsF family glycosyltransferase n=1 Tax=Spirulina sp. CS-785/01 TaxID=3021716 RepID=UPI00232B704B|nr:WecB/TagA/CpsF family glycosyltransferase [Spirulina sp. CS-785/01]MDB9315529.1 WecB/TagA/CpsF family glycosyltransferase [Spirulina sp. CS-785/01]
MVGIGYLLSQQRLTQESGQLHSNHIVPKVNVTGAPITQLSKAAHIQTILQWAKHNQSRTVYAANVHMLMEAYWCADFATVLHNADMATPDGMPLVWMMKLLGNKRQERVTGSDLFQEICSQAQVQGVSVYFVGSETPVLDRMKTRLQQDFPKLAIAGMEPLPFRPLTESEDEALIQRINESGAGVVFVALGCPKQEKWIAQHRGKINAVMCGVGAVFAIYAGLVKRAPERWQKLGLEWLYRLVQEPQRLWKRYTSTIPPFLWLAVQQLLVKGEITPQEAPEVVELRPHHSQPIGQLLQQAGLLSLEQVEATLNLQRQNPHLRFGELLVQQGWLPKQTIDFFVEHLPRVTDQGHQQPLGQYLKSAALLSDRQIQTILEEQSQVELRFGELAVRKGWLKPETLNVVLQYLQPELAAVA